VGQADIKEAGRTATDNPITRALRRATGTKWCIFQGNTAYALTPPHRSLSLPDIVREHWEQYQDSGRMQPFEFDLAGQGLAPAPHPIQERRRNDRREHERRVRERRLHERRSI